MGCNKYFVEVVDNLGETVKSVVAVLIHVRSSLVRRVTDTDEQTADEGAIGLQFVWGRSMISLFCRHSVLKR